MWRFVLVASLIALPTAETVRAAGRPNVLFLLSDDQRFERSRADNAAHVRDHPTDEAFECAAYLRHGDADFALGGLDWLVPTAVARTRGRRRP